MGMTVVTYGGGEILNNIFNAVAMFMNGGKGNLFQCLMVIMISIGALWATAKAFFSSSMQSFLSSFIFPLIAIVGLLMTPTATVHIEDLLVKQNSQSVDHVPFLLAKFTELASSIGYQITRGVETVMHVPNDISYNSTGMIFGADSAMDIGRYQISDADLAKNLKSFTKQCVLYDVSLGKYSLDEMKKATDLWKFFEDNTSKVRMIRYQPIGGEKAKAIGTNKLGEYLSCQDAIKKMTPYFKKEKSYYGQLDVCKNLPLTFQALTGMQKAQEELIGQQLMMSTLLNEYGGNAFAKSRAYMQQRSTYQALGALAASSLVTLRAVIEALVYAAFIFIIPLSVLPGGLKYLMTWAGLVVWIQLWPPFYAILNYIMHTVANGYANSVLHGLSDSEQGLSLFTSIGLNNLQHDVYALSGYLAASIPFLTYAILKGGVGSFIHLASSIMSPAHSAAATAATEQTSGNYSFGNASMGQTSFQNTTAFQKNLAPSLTSGFMQENRGTYSATYGSGEQIIRQGNSELRTGIFSDGSISEVSQRSLTHQESVTEAHQQQYAESISNASKHLADFTEHTANSQNYSENISEREALDLQESARFMQSQSENLAQQTGLSSRETTELLMGGGINFVVTANSTTNFGSNKDHTLSEAGNIAKSEEFQQHFQRLQDYSQSQSYNSLDDKGKRLAESTSQSLDDVRSSQEMYQVSQSKLDQISTNTSWAEQNSHSIRRSLNQDFVNWASNQYAGEGGFAKARDIWTNGTHEQQEALVNNFVGYVRGKAPNYSEEFASSSIGRELPKHISKEGAHESIRDSIASYQDGFKNNLTEQRHYLKSRSSTTSEDLNDKVGRISEKMDYLHETATQEFEKESERSIYSRQFDEVREPLQRVKNYVEENHPRLAKILKKQATMGMDSKRAERILRENDEPKLISNNFQMTEEPFWMESKKG